MYRKTWRIKNVVPGAVLLSFFLGQTNGVHQESRGDDLPADQGRFLVLTCDRLLDSAVEISKSNVLACRTIKNAGIGFVPGGAYDGIWLTDCTFLLEAYRFWGPAYKDFLYSDSSAARGIVARFAEHQDTDGLIPMVFWGERGEVDYGGRYDLAQQRKQNRDMESPYTFVHLNYIYWLDTGDATYLRQYRTAMRRALDPIDVRRDPSTGLILATYGPPNSDVSADYAVPRTTAHPYFNALYVRAYREYAAVAEALDDGVEARVYREKAEALRSAMNRHLWVPERRRYETKILRCPVSTDSQLPAGAIENDARFPVIDNMLLLYYGIPDSRQKRESLVETIEASEQGLAVVGQMVEPPYPDGFMSRASGLFNGGNYHNGDVWTWFSNRYATALYRLGYPELANRVLWSQARVAVRDQGFAEYYEDDAVGKAKGAFPYAPTAASFQLAVVEGLFGLEIDAPRRVLRVCPSLFQSGTIRLRLGGKPVEVSVHLQPDRSEIRVGVAGDFAGRAEFRILIPSRFGHVESWSVHAENLQEEAVIASVLEQVGRARYVRFGTELAPGVHTFALLPSSPQDHP